MESVKEVLRKSFGLKCDWPECCANSHNVHHSYCHVHQGILTAIEKLERTSAIVPNYTVDQIAKFIRSVDEKHDNGVGELAELIHKLTTQGR